MRTSTLEFDRERTTSSTRDRNVVRADRRQTFKGRRDLSRARVIGQRRDERHIAAFGGDLRGQRQRTRHPVQRDDRRARRDTWTRDFLTLDKRPRSRVKTSDFIRAGLQHHRSARRGGRIGGKHNRPSVNGQYRRVRCDAFARDLIAGEEGARGRVQAGDVVDARDRFARPFSRTDQITGSLRGGALTLQREREPATARTRESQRLQSIDIVSLKRRFRNIFKPAHFQPTIFAVHDTIQRHSPRARTTHSTGHNTRIKSAFTVLIDHRLENRRHTTTWYCYIFARKFTHIHVKIAFSIDTDTTIIVKSLFTELIGL